MDKPVKNLLQQLLADLTPEELEPRLELQIFIDPMASLTDTNNNNNNNNNNTNEPTTEPSGPIWV